MISLPHGDSSLRTPDATVSLAADRPFKRTSTGGRPLETKPPTHRARENMAVGIAIVVLIALLVLLWEFHGLIYQYFSG